MDRVLRHIPDHQLGGQQDKFLGNGERVCSLIRSLKERDGKMENQQMQKRLVDSPVGGGTKHADLWDSHRCPLESIHHRGVTEQPG